MALQVLFYAYYQTVNPFWGNFLEVKEKSR
jgi:hypothetical protein